VLTELITSPAKVYVTTAEAEANVINGFNVIKSFVYIF
jgi:hypothetical protein